MTGVKVTIITPFSDISDFTETNVICQALFLEAAQSPQIFKRCS
jgi:hypothetical protein